MCIVCRDVVDNMNGVLSDEQDLRSSYASLKDSVNEDFGNDNYIYSWKHINKEIKKIGSRYDLDLCDNTEPWSDRSYEAILFQSEVKKRILSELEHGVADGIPFWKDILNDDDVQVIEDKVSFKYYSAVEDGLSLDMCIDADYGGFLSMVNSYNVVFGKYPDKFIDSFQEIVGGFVDSVVSSEVSSDQVLRSLWDVRNALDVLDLSVDSLQLIYNKMQALKKSYPETYIEIVPLDW